MSQIHNTLTPSCPPSCALGCSPPKFLRFLGSSRPTRREGSLNPNLGVHRSRAPNTHCTEAGQGWERRGPPRAHDRLVDGVVDGVVERRSRLAAGALKECLSPTPRQPPGFLHAGAHHLWPQVHVYRCPSLFLIPGPGQPWPRSRLRTKGLHAGLPLSFPLVPLGASAWIPEGQGPPGDAGQLPMFLAGRKDASEEAEASLLLRPRIAPASLPQSHLAEKEGALKISQHYANRAEYNYLHEVANIESFLCPPPKCLIHVRPHPD